MADLNIAAAVNWEAVINKWMASTFVSPSTGNPGLYTEVPFWNKLGGAVRIKLQEYPSLIPDQLPETYASPYELSPTLLLTAFANYDAVAKNSFITFLEQHLNAALTYKENVVTEVHKVYGIGLVFPELSLSCSAAQSGSAVGNMIKLLNQIPKWWQQKVDIETAKTKSGATVLKNLEKKGLAESYGNESIYVITDSTVKVPTSTNKMIIFKPDRIKDIDVVDDNGEHRYNPPPHKTSRVLSPIAYTQNLSRGKGVAYEQEGVGKDGNGKVIFRDGNVPNWLRDADLAVASQLGFFYQDAVNTNRAKDWVNGGRSTRMTDLYGFQFMYNPTSIQQTLSTNVDVDWMGQGNGAGADPAIPLFGSSVVQFDLYINRVADMSALHKGMTEAETRAGYRRLLSSGEIEGLTSRGTEYDLEFLFRTINGTPYRSPTMDSNLPTSDFGLLMGMPIWLKLHDNLRYKGVITNLSINHIMFTRDMIPMLTTVGVQFMRIPVITWDSTLASKALKDYSQKQDTDQKAE